MKKIKRLVSSFLVAIMLMTTMITAMPVVSIAASVSLFWPADSRKINSYYGNRTYVDNNGQTVSDFHSGIDISGSTGNNIYAAAAGTVVEAVNNHSSYGNYVLLHHPELGIYTLYAHCSKLNVSVGQSVYVGQVIAYIGATGNVTGAHLHFETRSGKSFSYHYNPMSNSFYYTVDHTCDYKKFVYYWATHPHYNCYACTICGNVIEDRNSSNYISTCTDCNRPSKPVILNLNEQYEVGTTVTISWTETSNTTHYNLWIWVQTDENTWEAFEHTYDVKNSLKRTFPIGKYKLIIQAYNSNLFESDHSDWLRCESDLTYFEVINPHTHSYTTNQTKAPTCTVAGILTYTCSCGDSYTEEIPALGHTPGTAIETKAPTCTEEGINTTYCSVCGEIVFEESVPMTNHNWSEWIQISAPTATEDGEQLRYCKTCKTSETEVIPALGEEPTPDPEPEPEDPVDPNAPAVVSVNNYTITLDKITDIKEIRFAIGHYTTGSEVKAAEKNVTLDASTVAKYTVDGVFTYDLPWMGEYTFWVRYNDGSQYFIYTNIDDITPYVESYGVKLTVKDYAENYKDMWLAEGTFNSYSEIKASTAFKYQASANKLNLYAKTTHDFSYVMTNPGAYTVLIRYNDGTTDVIHTELTVDVPEFSVNGLQTTVQNIPDIKIIRTAYGHYTSVGDIKKASGVRNFSNKNDIKNAEEYMIQYREAGEVTLIVEYNNGYKHFCYINIEPKSATMIQSKNTVMFDDLDGFVMIRYAKGTYTTSSQIKAAEGSKVLKPADLVGGYAIISDLEAGTYTFCVQFDDESYDYYTVTVA